MARKGFGGVKHWPEEGVCGETWPEKGVEGGGNIVWPEKRVGGETFFGLKRGWGVKHSLA